MKKLLLIGALVLTKLGTIQAQTHIPPSVCTSSYWVYEFWDAVGIDKMCTYLGNPYDPQPPHVYDKVKRGKNLLVDDGPWLASQSNLHGVNGCWHQ